MKKGLLTAAALELLVVSHVAISAEAPVFLSCDYEITMDREISKKGLFGGVEDRRSLQETRTYLFKLDLSNESFVESQAGSDQSTLCPIYRLESSSVVLIENSDIAGESVDKWTISRIDLTTQYEGHGVLSAGPNKVESWSTGEGLCKTMTEQEYLSNAPERVWTPPGGC